MIVFTYHVITIILWNKIDLWVKILIVCLEWYFYSKNLSIESLMEKLQLTVQLLLGKSHPGSKIKHGVKC